MTCRLKCHEVKEEHDWHRVEKNTPYITFHENKTCPNRLVLCPQKCGIWVSLALLDQHTVERCLLRPVSDMSCRNGCGQIFYGTTNKLIELETERMLHEIEECPERRMVCQFKNCDAKIKAKESIAHQKSHLYQDGLSTFRTAGVATFTVPPRTKKIKIQIWGAGGGSGHLRRQKAGAGGGGAFLQGTLFVTAGEVSHDETRYFN